MPGRNGKGPMGEGPVTGRGRGLCGGHHATAQQPSGAPGSGMGRGGGRGGGRGHRHGFHATGLTGWQRAQSAAEPTIAPSPARDSVLAGLKQQAEQLEKALGELKARIQQVQGPAPDAAGREEK